MIKRIVVFLVVAAVAGAQTVPQRAGQVAAEAAHASIVRAAGKSAAPVEAAKGTEVDWDDTLSTDASGRARIVLDDQSILTLGSNSRLRVIKHDASSQQTELELGLGRIRCQVNQLNG